MRALALSLSAEKCPRSVGWTALALDAGRVIPNVCLAYLCGGIADMGYRVAVVGATGAVGHEMLNILAERQFPVDEVVALASRASAGKEVSFGEDDVLSVRALEDFDFEGFDLGLFRPAPPSPRSMRRAAAAGCVVIDNTSQFRMDPDVPLVVPEVNREALEGFRERNIIANPNCSTLQMVVALKPLHDLAIVRRVVVATYQSVSGAGREAMDELFEQTKGIYETRTPEPKHFPKQIAFNVIPHIDVFLDDGSSKEEWKMAVETKKILDPAIEVAPPACACRCSSAMRSRRMSSSSTSSRSMPRARPCTSSRACCWSTIRRRAST